jgi:hypothetical protein
MADKRMFSLQIVDSDAFLELPPSAQALYFHLGMRADDDGFINNAKTIAKVVGVNHKDFDILVDKRFIYAFEGGISLIKHWKVNNYIAKDRYKKTAYTDILESLETKENGSYTFRGQNVDKLSTQVSIDKVSIDKVRLDKISKDIVQPRVEPKIVETYNLSLLQIFWDAYPKKVGKGKVEEWFKKNKPDEDLVGQMVDSINNQLMSKQWQDSQYIPLPMTWLNQKRWEDELPPSQEAVKKKEIDKQIEMEDEIERLTRMESIKIRQKQEAEKPKVSDDELNSMLNNLGSLAEGKKF